ncbi:adenylosuccinate synthase [Promineifilum sp.]|uniref:adenylosuccinate synthase n=1 Tax=Promineifilum sp. TaxID=2664178 RepID=UPI0035B2D2DC
MPMTIIIGAQWGDEGKGHITDRLAQDAAIVARYSGGDNAGHTVTIGREVFKLHLIPSGIIHPGVVCLVGNGAVVNPAVMLREMDALAARGVSVAPARLKLSDGAHLITPAHIAMDKAHEKQRGGAAIGTTLRGIGPVYTDKARRIGLRAALLADEEALAEAVQAHVAAKNEVLVKVYGEEPLDAHAVAAEYVGYARRLAPHLVDGPLLLDEALQQGQMVLAEGAQGTLLDIDHGTYPFVTSSSPTAGGAITGLGVGPRLVDRVIGVAKAFTSRVGGGPFPTELSDDAAVRLRGTGENPWDEYGTTTGRPRRVGWLDLPMLRHARRVNSLSEWVLTKLDILSGLPEIPVCVGYELDGRRVDSFPTDLPTLARCRPLYERLPGWAEDIMGARRPDELPDNARRYVDFVAKESGAPVGYVSVGPGREQFIVME